jgi:tetratricopeptide (TPR) repeat protein
VTLAVIGMALLVERSSRRQPDRRPAIERAAFSAGLGVSLALAVSTCLRIRDYASPLAMAQSVLAGWPGPAAHQLVGQELAAAGRHDEALAHLGEAAQAHPPAHYFLGLELFTVGRYDEAIPELERFVRDEPALPVVPSARVMIGRAHASRGRWAQAMEQARLVLAASPDHAEAHGLMAEALMAGRRFDEAIPHYRAFVAARASDPAGWTGLGIACISSGKAGDAIEAFRHAVDLVPASVPYRQNLARAFVAAGNVDAAVDEVRQAARLNPNDPGAHEMFARVLVSQHRVEEARGELERALQIDPGFAAARDLLRSLPPR